MATIDEEIKSRFKSDKHRFFVNLAYTANWFQRDMAANMKPFGISMQQFNVLRILRGASGGGPNGGLGSRGWMPMNEINARMVDKTPNTTRLSDKLLEKEYVERRRCETDRRVVFLKISEKGMTLLKEIDQLENKGFHSLQERLTDEEAIAFSALLDRLRG